MHKFIIAGRLAKAPELLEGENYKKVHLNIASDKTVKNGDSYEQGTAWNSVTVFGKTAENCALFLQKGQYVVVEGDIENVKKEDKYVTYLTASKVQFGPKASGRSTEEVMKENLDSVPF